MIEIIPTNTCPPDLAELSRCSELIASFAPIVQLDVSDGIFSPVCSWPYGEGQMSELENLKGLPEEKTLRYEIHLMVQAPREIGCSLARVGAQRIIAHAEVFGSTDESLRALDAWRTAGASEVGLALLLDTPISILESLISSCDVVQVMSIATLGRQGAPFDERVISRIEELHARYPDLLIEIDGGVSASNIPALVRAGARRFGVGSAIMKAPDLSVAYAKIKHLAEAALV